MAEAEVWEKGKEKKRLSAASAGVRGGALIRGSCRGRKRTKSRTVGGAAGSEERTDPGSWGKRNPEGIRLSSHRHRFPQTWCFFPSTLPPRSKPAIPACHPQMPRRTLPCSSLCLRHQSLAISIPFLPEHKVALAAQALARQMEGDDRTLT